MSRRFEKLTLERNRSAAGPMWSPTVDAGKSVTLQARSELLGPRSSDQSRLVEFRRACASIFTATTTPISKPSRPGSTTCGARPIRAAGRPAMTFPPCATAASSRNHFRSGLPKFASDFVFNTRRPVFADIRVRQAIALLFDFEWINRNFFYNLYQTQRKLLRRFRIVRLSPPGRRARARAAGAVS